MNHTKTKPKKKQITIHITRVSEQWKAEFNGCISYGDNEIDAAINVLINADEPVGKGWRQKIVE